MERRNVVSLLHRGNSPGFFRKKCIVSKADFDKTKSGVSDFLGPPVAGVPLFLTLALFLLALFALYMDVIEDRKSLGTALIDSSGNLDVVSNGKLFEISRGHHNFFEVFFPPRFSCSVFLHVFIHLSYFDLFTGICSFYISYAEVS